MCLVELQGRQMQTSIERIGGNAGNRRGYVDDGQLCTATEGSGSDFSDSGSTQVNRLRVDAFKCIILNGCKSSR